MEQTNLLLADVAKLLRRKPYQITYALSVGLIPEPKLRIANKRVFQHVDIQRMARHFGVRLEESDA
ncbi:hypothetical protein LCGC14_2622540 [marine sediment metagenome]|uniref:Uncharacterized protein n=1 Tax=marine sediment metagenome TaxID=412755 RepID=A0A0F9CDQ5_9ZZZZ